MWNHKERLVASDIHFGLSLIVIGLEGKAVIRLIGLIGVRFQLTCSVT